MCVCVFLFYSPDGFLKNKMMGGRKGETTVSQQPGAWFSPLHTDCPRFKCLLWLHIGFEPFSPYFQVNPISMSNLRSLLLLLTISRS